jgi:hypothetical protein
VWLENPAPAGRQYIEPAGKQPVSIFWQSLIRSLIVKAPPDSAL